MGVIFTVASLAGTFLHQREESRKGRHAAEDVQRDVKIVAEQEERDIRAGEAKATEEANEARKKRAAELAEGGRAAQVKTGPLGVTGTANVGKKTLFGG